MTQAACLECEMDNYTTPTECTFQKINYFTDLLFLVLDQNCYRHPLIFTVLLCLANLLILLIGIIGNSVVIFVTIFRLKNMTASNIFMLNLAVADLLVILCCIPMTLAANVFTPWIFSEVTCKAVAYTQRLSIFCSVYSLVVISIDRCRALHSSFGLSTTLSKYQACTIVLGIWIFGFVVTLPWALSIEPEPVTIPGILDVKISFCQEIWKTKTHETAYFILVQVLARFAIPLISLTVCNIFIWRDIPPLTPERAILVLPGCMDFRDKNRQRKLRIFKMFVGINVAFLVFWLPFYIITARLNFLQDATEFIGTTLERQLTSILIPMAQLLSSCNSCINPFLYCFLSKSFNDSFRAIFTIQCKQGNEYSESSIETVTQNANSLTRKSEKIV